MEQRNDTTEIIVTRTGMIEKEPTNVNIPNMDVKLERSSKGIYVLVFTGTNENGDRYCARIHPKDVNIYIASGNETEER